MNFNLSDGRLLSAGHGTAIARFKKVTGFETRFRPGVWETISTHHHCITCMREYEDKSLEELRMEDYAANRKGPQVGQGVQPSSGLFGSMQQTSLFGNASTSQPTATGLFEASTVNTLFGSTIQNPSVMGPVFSFGTATTANTFGFNTATNTTNPFGTNMATVKPFGTTQPSLFGAFTSQMTTGFWFGNTTPAFVNGAFSTHPNQTDIEVGELLKSIREVCRCNNCNDAVSAPVLQCNNGHITCSSCSKKLPHCPLCQAGFSPTPSQTLQQLLKLLPKTCRYADIGCSQTVTENHIKYCEYRPIKCQGGDGICEWKGSVKDWWPHVEAEHKYSSFSGQGYLKYTGRNDAIYCHKYVDDMFLFKVYEEDGLLYHCARHIPTEKPKHALYYDISVRKGRNLLYRSVIPTLPLEESDSFDSHRMSILSRDVAGVQDIRLVIDVVKIPI